MLHTMAMPMQSLFTSESSPAVTAKKTPKLPPVVLHPACKLVTIVN